MLTKNGLYQITHSKHKKDFLKLFVDVLNSLLLGFTSAKTMINMKIISYTKKECFLLQILNCYTKQ